MNHILVLTQLNFHTLTSHMFSIFYNFYVLFKLRTKFEKKVWEKWGCFDWDKYNEKVHKKF